VAGYLTGRIWMHGAPAAPRIPEVSMSSYPIGTATLVGARREPSVGLPSELQHYARIEGLTAADLKRVRPSDRLSAAGAIRDCVAALRHPRRMVPSRQH
jgi:hypothetical protein